jgi:flagellar hook-associated protein 1 FlgK
MSLLTTLHAARRGISVASEGINVVAHNTANATTDGYSKRTMTVSTMYPLYRNGVWLGQGPGRPSFRRTADAFVDQNMISTAGNQSEAKELYDALRLVEARLNDGTSSSIIETYQAFMEGLKGLAVDPADPVFRDQAVMYGELFTNSVNETSGFILQLKEATREDMKIVVTNLNDSLATVADLNQRMKMAGGAISQGDLQDQRDLVIREIAESTGATVRFQPDGQAIVYIDGHIVVQEEDHRELSYYEDGSGDPQIAVAANSGRITVTDSLSGRLGGRFEAYDVADGLLDDLNDWVTTFTTDFNAIHQTGFDQSGNTGLDFFSVSSISPAASFSIDAALLEDSSLIATADAVNPVTGFPDAGNRVILDQLVELEDTSSYGVSGTFTAREQLTSLFAGIAREVKSAESNYEMQSMRMQDISELRASISGVNLDEEAMKLMQYQASYQAASRVISVTNSLMSELMNII